MPDHPPENSLLAADHFHAQLALEAFELRFQSPATESDYQHWRLETAIPFTRIGILGSILGWFGVIAALAIGWPDSVKLGAALIVLLILPVFAGTILLTTVPRLWSWVMAASAFANVVAGLLIVGICAWLVESPNLIAGGVVVVAYFGLTIFRLPPILATLGVIPCVLLAQGLLVRLYFQGHLGFTESVGFSFMLWIAFFTGLLVCVALERVTRTAYKNQRIIERQRQALVEERAQLSRFLDPEVTRMVRERGVGNTLTQKTLPITVVCCDLRGFTRYTELHGADQMAEVLRSYYDNAVDAARRYGATIKDFAGDGVLMLIGAPLERPDHAQAGLDLARDLISTVGELLRSVATGPRRLGVGVGIATGLCAVGAIGSQSRLEYTAVGASVNLAARLCDHAADGEILISQETIREVKHNVAWRQQLMQLKGFADPVPVLVETPTSDNLSNPSDLQARAQPSRSIWTPSAKNEGRRK